MFKAIKQYLARRRAEAQESHEFEQYLEKNMTNHNFPW